MVQASCANVLVMWLPCTFLGGRNHPHSPHPQPNPAQGYFWRLAPDAVGRQCACCAGGQHGGGPVAPEEDECMQLLADVLARYSDATETIRSDGSGSRKIWAMDRMQVGPLCLGVCGATGGVMWGWGGGL